MRQIVVFAVFGIGLGWCGQARADLAPPLPPNKEAVTVKIEVDNNAKGPVLVVPNGVFTQPRVRPLPPKSAPKDGDKSSIEPDNGDAVAGEPEQSQPRNQMLIAGVAVALSLAFGGLWFIRKGTSGSIRGLTLLVAAGATLAVGALVYANVPPPKTFERPPVGKNPPAYPIALESKVKVEFVFGQEPVRLILDKESFEKLKKGELKEVK